MSNQIAFFSYSFRKLLNLRKESGRAVPEETLEAVADAEAGEAVGGDVGGAEEGEVVGLEGGVSEEEVVGE